MKRHFRSVFLSDLHLGTTGCQAQQLARLLRGIRCQRLYLVGDIIDMWRLKQRWYWPAGHNEVVRRILKLANKHGTEVIFVPGNHDEAARQYCHMEFGGVTVKAMDVHTTRDGRRLLVTHGDQYDLVVKHSRLLSLMGSMAYEWLIKINVLYNRGRQMIGLPFWSLSQFLKLKVKSACTYISKFEDTLLDEARRRHLDGVICGHIHKGEAFEASNGVQYYNCGDWVESCTLIVEQQDGQMQMLDGLALLEELDAANATHHEEPVAESLSNPSRGALDWLDQPQQPLTDALAREAERMGLPAAEAPLVESSLR
jgi:UDP-2,3-diacylglucosamine pyrophosphatase LpxH